jgi:pyruvate carboxylase
MSMAKVRRIRKLLVANRGEIAIRVSRAANELGIATVAIYSREDRFSLHRFKTDESYLVGEGQTPIGAYLDIEDILRIARDAGADAVHPGYGFLSESPEFAEACRDAGLIFVGPPPEVMRKLGDKVSARHLAAEAGVPLMPASDALPDDNDLILAEARRIGYPLMVKASWGGGGRGMRDVDSEKTVLEAVHTARREAAASFGKDEVYLEKRIVSARHVEVQVLADEAGTAVHLFERECSLQRRHQKVIERAPAPYLTSDPRQVLGDWALKLARAAGYQNAGTVEFLMDKASGQFYFIEVNPRVQVEHTVTEEVTGIDIVKAQIRLAEGARLGQGEPGLPGQDEIKLGGHAIQCRITTEDPDNSFIPDYGRIQAYRGATGFGIRLDGGTAYSGAVVTRYYDSLLEKVTAWAPTPEEAIRRMDRALREFRIRGVATNLVFLETLINHPAFATADYSTTFIDETPELFHTVHRRDRATRILSFIGDVIVNGNTEVKDRALPPFSGRVPAPSGLPDLPPEGYRQKLQALGAEGFAKWMLEQNRVLVTDTTFRDAHQSLFATRMRTRDMLAVAPAYAALLPNLFSIECWGGATFDVAMRFLTEDPWDRLERLREAMPNTLLQMLLRASNAVGYTNYPDNVVDFFTQRAAQAGIDLFRIFDSLNWSENMKAAIDSVLRSGKLCEAAICYTGDLSSDRETKYTLDYYVALARELKAAGTHILGIKDMAGLAKPAAIAKLVPVLKAETGLPVHFHTHDTSGIAAASVLAAVEAGADAVDAAMDSMSGLTSQPNMGSILSALQGAPRDPGIDLDAVRRISHYWEGVRKLYAPFEADIRSGTSDVYNHEMPGGQYTNLRMQARALGIEEKWQQVALAYAQVNAMFGNIPKVTPSSKVVGDLALYMVTSGVTPEDVMNPAKDMAFPDSVTAYFHGDLGQPPGGFPQSLQKRVLKGAKPLTGRPGEALAPVDLEEARRQVEEKTGDAPDDFRLASYLLYPQVYLDFVERRKKFGPVEEVPTRAFFYGMEVNEEIAVDIERGKTLIIRYLATSEPNEAGVREVFFELNGQPRLVKVADQGLSKTVRHHPKAADGDLTQVGAPMPGLISSIAVTAGETVREGDVLLTIEAMKMETAVHAEAGGTVAEILVTPGQQVDAKDLLVRLG